MGKTGEGTGPVDRPTRDHLLLHWCEHTEDLLLVGRRHLVETDPPPAQPNGDDVRGPGRPADDSS